MRLLVNAAQTWGLVQVEDEAREFCRRTRPRLVGALSLLTGDRGVAEELAQEALVRAWSRWRQVGRLGEPAVSAWTYRVAVNLANSWLRRRVAERRAMARFGSGAVSDHVDPDVADKIAIRRAVAALPRRQRTALVLRYFVDLPVAEVAEVMQCPPGTVKSLTSLAMTNLRRQFASETVAGVSDGP